MTLRLLILLFVLTCTCCSAQVASVKVQWLWGNEPLELDTPLLTTSKDTVKFDHAKFYLSKLKLWKQGAVIYTLTKPAHLVDLDQPESLVLKLDKPVLADAVSFELGLDSTLQVAGVKGQDLDPTNGMYWTWNSGYIILKVDGTSPTCQTRKHLFTYHVGGYKKPNQCLATVHLPVVASSNQEIELDIDLKQWMDQISLAESPSVMEPCKKAVTLLDAFANQFKVKQ